MGDIQCYSPAKDPGIWIRFLRCRETSPPCLVQIQIHPETVREKRAEEVRGSTDNYLSRTKKYKVNDEVNTYHNIHNPNEFNVT